MYIYAVEYSFDAYKYWEYFSTTASVFWLHDYVLVEPSTKNVDIWQKHKKRETSILTLQNLSNYNSGF